MILAQYRGNDIPGQLVDSSGNGRDLVLVGAAIPNPGSPPPPEGSNWLAKLDSYIGFNYLQAPGSVVSVPQGSVEGSFLPDHNDFNSNMLVSFNGTFGFFNDKLIIPVDPTSGPGTYRFFALQNTPFVFIDSFNNPLDGLTHHFKFEWGAFGARLYLDGALLGSTLTVPVMPTSNVSLGGWELNDDENMVHTHLDNVIFTDGQTGSQIESGSIESGSIESGSIEGGAIE